MLVVRSLSSSSRALGRAGGQVPPRCMKRMTAYASLLVLLVVPAVHASGNFPADIQNHLQAPAVLPCTLCHQSPQGGDAVVTAFGQALKAEGLAGLGDTAALTAALDALEADGTDSDGDGSGDVAELRAGRDPNVDDGDVDGGGGDGPPVPAYGFGCAAGGHASFASVEVVALGAVVAAGRAMVRRRRRVC